MVLNKRVITNLLFLIFLAIIFFTPVGTWVKTKITQLAITEPAISNNTATKTLSNKAFDLELKGYNNQADINLNQLKGKVIFLNFWATWCPPCRAEMPSIQKLYNKKGDKIAFVLVAMQDKPEKISSYLQDNSITVPAYELNSLLHESLKPKSFPTTLIINKQGEVVLKETGAADWDSESVHQLLDELIR